MEWVHGLSWQDAAEPSVLWSPRQKQQWKQQHHSSKSALISTNIHWLGLSDNQNTLSDNTSADQNQTCPDLYYLKKK